MNLSNNDLIELEERESSVAARLRALESAVFGSPSNATPSINSEQEATDAERRLAALEAAVFASRNAQLGGGGSTLPPAATATPTVTTAATTATIDMNSKSSRDTDSTRSSRSSRAGEQCSICLEGLTPATTSTTQCGHKFHTRCIGRVLSTASHEDGQVCPLCRADLSVDPIFLALQDSLVPIQVGNLYKELAASELPEGASSQCVHWYEAFVKCDRPGMLRKVQFHLHPTYKNRTALGRPTSNPDIRGAYSITRRAWGYFTIHVEILTRDGTTHRVEIPLNFNRARSQRTILLNGENPAADWRDEDVFPERRRRDQSRRQNSTTQV